MMGEASREKERGDRREKRGERREKRGKKRDLSLSLSVSLPDNLNPIWSVKDVQIRLRIEKLTIISSLPVRILKRLSHVRHEQDNLCRTRDRFVVDLCSE